MGYWWHVVSLVLCHHSESELQMAEAGGSVPVTAVTAVLCRWMGEQPLLCRVERRAVECTEHHCWPVEMKHEKHLTGSWWVTQNLNGVLSEYYNGNYVSGMTHIITHRTRKYAYVSKAHHLGFQNWFEKNKNKTK